MQLLPQSHLHPQVVVDEEAHRMVGVVVVVVRVVLVVWGHEAVCAHLHQQRRHKSRRQSSDFGPPASRPLQPEPFFPESHSWLGKDISLTLLLQSEPLIKATHIRRACMTLLKQPKHSCCMKQLQPCPILKNSRVYLVTGVERSQQHHSSRRRTVNVPVFGFQSTGTKESERRDDTA